MPTHLNLLEEELPREKLIANGPETLTKVELLAILLRTGTKGKNVLELSREIIEKLGETQITRKTYEELLKFHGINKAKACQIVSVFELSRRLASNQTNSQTKTQIKNSDDIYNLIKHDFDALTHEKVMAIFVDSKNQIIKKEFIFEGGINYSIIEPRKVITKALYLNASGFFLAHNHPSGDTMPSEEDINITKKLKNISVQLNIRFLDHIIIGDEYYSLFENNLL